MKQNIMQLLAMTFIVISCVSFAGFNYATTQEESSSDFIYYIPVDTEVNHGLAGFIKRSLETAKKEKAVAVILGIDTFGGRVDAALDIVNHIEKNSDQPIIAFVTDKAWSAGALIALGCKTVVMKAGSSMGSATPVSGGGPGGQSKALGEKHVSAIRAKFRSIAEKNGYPANLAAAMVDKDIEVHQTIVDGQKQYLTPAEIELAKKQKKKVEQGPVISPKDKLLNLTAKQAQSVTMAHTVAENLDELLKQHQLAGKTVKYQKRNWAEHFAGFATSATLSGLLLMLGLMALYTELSNPGFGWAGVAGIICLGLLFWGKYIVNLAEMTEVIIFFAGVALLLIEIFVIPGFGFAGIAGLILMCLGLYLAFVPFVVPKLPWDFSLFFKAIWTMLLSILGSLTGFLVLMHFLPELPGVRRLVLTRSLKENESLTEPAQIKNELVGQTGIATTDLRPVGKAKFNERLIDVVSESGFIPKKKTVEIINIEGNRILVREHKAVQK